MSQSPDIDALLDAAIESHEARDLDTAERLYRDILSADPEHSETLNLLGLIQQDRGKVDESIALISRAIEIEPDFPEALANLARAFSFRGEPRNAADAAREATVRDPSLGEGWRQLGRALLDLEQYSEALTALQQALTHFSGDVSIYTGIGYAAQSLQQHPIAAEAWGKVLEIQPDRVEAMVNLGAAYSHMKQLDEALELHRRAAALAPGDVTAMGALAATLHQRYDAAELVPVCRAALALAPQRADLLTILGSGLMWLGRFEEAAASCRAALAVRPDSIPARQLLGVLDPKTLDTSTIERFREQLKDPSLTLQDRASAAFSTANALDDAGEFDAAFSMYRTANRIYYDDAQASGSGYNLDAFKAYIDWIRITFTPPVFEQMRSEGNPSDLPVFIVGMPRSGTSLVEQIAASHPKVFGAGERRDIVGIVSRLNRGSRNIPIRRWDRKQLREEADGQIDRLKSLGGEAVRVIDKMPDNIKALGQIRLLYPNARIIVCHRDPRDVCVSCFTNHFAAGFDWSWDIEDCARQSVEIERLMDHWRAVLPGPMLEIDYETLVDDLEAESRRLIAFLGLDWDPACLQFHTSERSVTTASTLQVRRPLYTTSIGKWRRYEDQLGPMLRILEENDPASPGQQPSAADSLRQAKLAMSHGDRSYSIEILREAALRFPADHDVFSNLGLALDANGEIEAAIDAWCHALTLQPDRAHSLARLGSLLSRTGRARESVDILQRAIALQPDELEYHRVLALALWELRDFDGTRAAFQRALELAPRDQDILLALGHYEAMLGRFDAAAGYYLRILEQNPDMTEARLSLLTIGKTDEAGDLADLDSVLNDPTVPEERRIMAGFALGKALDTTGDPDRAFNACNIANQLMRSRATPEKLGGGEITALVDSLIGTFPRGVFQSVSDWGDPSELPVFIVGMPRSGTSLVEQILASHPGVFGAGERADIVPAAQAIMKSGTPDRPASWDPAQVRQQAQMEVERLRALGGEASRVIDKLPDNVFWLGHIRLMLPKARIILCQRDPRDIGLSCYFNYLSEHDWTTDLGDIGARIRAAYRIIAHWRDVLPGPVIEVGYENLVANMEVESRRLVDFLGLNWDPACLDFHRTERPVTTASVWQVRQQLYDSSVGRWRLYERHLGSLLASLRDTVRDHGPPTDRLQEAR